MATTFDLIATSTKDGFVTMPLVAFDWHFTRKD